MHTRRLFLKHGACALLTVGFVPEFVTRVAAAAGGRRRVLVVVFQRGAVDGLNMVVPHGDPFYYQARPSIAIGRPGSEGGAIDLDGYFGLHPRLAPLERFWRERALAVVHACGSPDATRSHFDAQDYMELGTPGRRSTPDGWINRCLQDRHDAEHASPFRAVAFAPQLPRSLQGRAASVAISDLTRFGVRDSAASFETAYASAADRRLRDAGREAFDAVRLLRTADPARLAPANGAVYPRSPLGDALRQVAQLVKADLGLEVAFAETGQWDHHVNEGGATGQLAQRLDDFARALSALAIDLGPAMAEVVIVTMSEFGRTVAENGARGTDHGHGNAMLLLGGPVKGGRVYGRWPGLAPGARYEGRDLGVTTDFRTVLAEIAARHLGAGDLASVFPGFEGRESVGVLG